ncbi:MAG: GGDEF domain-containing phosphodiesterase [Candidatus Sedimenticola endophacoides]
MAVSGCVGQRLYDTLYSQPVYRLLGVDETCLTLARIGVDRYALLVETPGSTEALDQVSERLRHALQEGVRVGREVLYLTVSVGISLYPGDAAEPGALTAHAEGALMEAKRHGRNRLFHYGSDDEEAVWDFAIEQALHQALREERFELLFQPQVDSAAGTVVGAEALLRLRDDTLKVPPLRFIRVAEDIGLIEAIGEWVMRRTCRLARAWHAADRIGFPLSVNLSARQLNCEGLGRLFQRILVEEMAEAAWFKLEITETAFASEVGCAIENIRDLHTMGFRISIDDFGICYSSLGRIKHFTLDEVKIDREFIRQLPDSPVDQAIIGAILELSRQLGVGVVAEGVENAAQLRLLRGMGCHLIQGYYVAWPMQWERLLDFLDDAGRIEPWRLAGAQAE